MLHKIKSLLKIFILIICIILGLSLVKSILKIAGSNQKITDEQEKVSELKKENQELSQKLNAVNSTQFIEQQARDKLGLAKKGEIVVVLPDTATLKALAPKLPEEKVSLPDPIYKKWLKLFL